MANSRKSQHPNSQRAQSKGKQRGNLPVDSNEAEDDSIIGRMFWKSLAVIGSLGILTAVGYFATRPAAKDGPEKKTATILPQERKAVTVTVPNIPFTDVTQDAGIDFVHFDGKQGERLLPETMGSGSGFIDYDNDGDEDILFVNSCDWPWTIRSDDQPLPTMRLYRNDGTGNFEDVTKGSGLDVTFYGMGPAFGDFDNDGWVDVFITAAGKNHLFRNDHGTFVDVTDATGVGGSDKQWSCPAMWFDYDRDGKLDLIVGNYVSWSREIDLSLASTLVGLERSYGQPTNFDGVHLYLYHNDGGTFSEVGEKAGLHVLNAATKVPEAKTLGIALLDANHDGWLDVCVANDTVKKFLFVNQRNGTFEDQGISMNVALTRDGQATGAMGIDCANYRNDDCCGIVVGNFANEPSNLYLSDGLKPSFTDVAPTTGFGPQTRLKLTFGVFFADLDLDGRLDIVCANGHLEPGIQKVFPTQQYEQAPQLFWNAGKRQPTQLLALSEEKTGKDFQKPMVGRSATYADIDGDGDLDILLTANGGKPRLLRNDQKTQHGWLRVRLKDKANTGAIGSTITLRGAKDEVFTRCITPTRSYLSQAELTATFGLGDRKPEELPKEITVQWADGTVQVVPIEKLNQLLVIEQPKD